MSGKSFPHATKLSDLCSNASAVPCVQRWRKQDQIEFDTEFFVRMLGRSPNSVDALRIVGELLSHRGQHKAALAIDKRLAQLCPEDCVVHYNLACSLALLGREGAAVSELKRAFRYGYTDLEYMERDPDLASVRKSSAYQSLVDEMTAASGEFYFDLESDLP